MPDPAQQAPLRRLTRQHLAEGFVLVACAVFLFAFVRLDYGGTPPLPDFADLPVDDKKAQFFDFLSPLVRDVNAGLAKDRDRLARLLERARAGERIGWLDRRWIAAQEERLEVDPDEDFLVRLETLYRRAGIVPEALVLAQAAIESGWGTSRFAVEGNNLFGQRCYREDCGIAPRGRPNANFGVAAFPSVAAAVESYVLNLNTHPQYQRFRDLRAELRAAEQPITGLALLPGLLGYSERGAAYVDEVETMIRSNGLE